jgi:hypothetical protein
MAERMATDSIRKKNTDTDKVQKILDPGSGNKKPFPVGKGLH